ncbi:MAG: HAMP domain-containing histidine kinase [Clostridia bacterium]|nr:HAMP domain-containing histidine kinase [Clostridia bacterium]
MARKKIDRTPRLPKSMTMISLIVAVGMLIVWAAGMYCLTAVTAEYAAEPFLERYAEYSSGLTRALDLNTKYTLELDAKTENYRNNRIWEVLAQASRGDDYSIKSNFYKGVNIPFVKERRPEIAFEDICDFLYVLFDGDGNIIASSNEDFIYFHYFTEEEWNTLDNHTFPSGKYIKVPFKRDKLSIDIESSSQLRSLAQGLKVEGYMQEEEFIPTKIAYIGEYEQWDDSADRPDFLRVWYAARTQDLEWNTIYEDPDAAVDGVQKVSIYTDSFDMCLAKPSHAFSYMGEKYESLTELAQKLGPDLADRTLRADEKEYSLSMTTIIPSVYYSYTAGGDIGESALPFVYEGASVNYYGLALVRCTPTLTAMLDLRHVYTVSFLLTAVIAAVILLIIRRHLIKPMQVVCDALCSEDPFADIEHYRSRRWYEGNKLQEGFINSRKAKQKLQDEISRLNAALDYAKTAEENRRRMVSDIAHELKTPLAVIHSYAEGIKEHIAEEKRDKYIDVILHEAQRTDLMVLQMLDLSRLEAGRVKLSREPFSLIEVTKEVFGRLDMLAQEKELRIEYVFPKDFEFNADRARITQAVENLASNAIKYTPQGGKIIVRVLNDKGGVSFTVENESQPMSKDALSKVWDAFYRTDESRSSVGTGLGLAIVKNIVLLHGGVCLARNTAMGVQFGFTI